MLISLYYYRRSQKAIFLHFAVFTNGFANSMTISKAYNSAVDLIRLLHETILLGKVQKKIPLWGGGGDQHGSFSTFIFLVPNGLKINFRQSFNNTFSWRFVP